MFDVDPGRRRSSVSRTATTFRSLLALGLLAGAVGCGDSGTDLPPEEFLTQNSGPIAWASDWSTATGNSYDALHDGGRWTGNLCTTTQLVNVVPSAGLDFPTANVLRVEYADIGQFCYMLQAVNQWRAPEVGESIYYRFYYRTAVPNGQDLGTAHFFHVGGAGYDYHAQWRNPGTPSNGRALLTTMWYLDGPAPYWSNRITINTNQTYRVEWRLQRTASAEMRMDVRVYDNNGALLFDDDDFINDLGTLASTDPTERLADPNALRVLEMGNNDPGGGSLFGTGNQVYVYYGGVAVSLDGWIGPYRSGEGGS